MTPPLAGRTLGRWRPGATQPRLGPQALQDALQRLARPVHVVDVDGQIGVAHDGSALLSADAQSCSAADGLPLLGFAPALRPQQLGDPEFRARHGLRYAYIGGAMANGIASEDMVIALGRAGLVGFFGAGGLEPDRIDQAIDRITTALGSRPFGFNLIHSPAEPRREAQTAELYVRRGIRLVSASAYLDLTEPLVYYRTAGIHRDAAGRVAVPNRVIAKVSRVEVARRFFGPPPPGLLDALVRRGALTPEQAELARTIPVAEDLTAEADSGGHTDNRPALALLPTMVALRDRMQAEHGYATRLRVGAAGGIGTPAAAAAAFALGAAYILTGSVNQACVEAGTSELVRRMLAEARQADVGMAPAGDMFEMGVQVQVLKRGTLFAPRARKLYELYRACGRLEDIPPTQRRALERDCFRMPLEEVWQQTREYFAARAPEQIARAEADPKHKLALVFRWYLGQSARWAQKGEPTRKVDYQIWCGPAIGAFNEWVRGSFLEPPENRDVVGVGLNLMFGAAALTRAGWLRAQGVPLPPQAERFEPRPLSDLETLLH